MNLLVGLAVGDIDSIRQNATLKRLAMQVEFVAEIEEGYPRFLTRQVYNPTLVFRPNCSTRWKRLMTLLGIKNFSTLDFGLPTDEEQSDLSEYTEVRKQLDKNKKRLKTLVSVTEVQIALLRRLARKIDPDGAEMDERSLDEISLTVADEQEAFAPDFLDGQLPNEIMPTDMPYTHNTYV
ncbi:Transient receptor putative cation channel sub A member 1 [Desmophyllum pertusum]|uniref:Transient receptor putative cation channel sub A member 1 n=1 Tax=Desmophyllum pertusum TaxID=174260 RepID=A0A9W9ZPW1_9CNID|nr:Transient receptor putative cation channel sub A member 1 [Desmophyllum pertusum]